MIEEIRANAHCAHTLSRMAVQAKKMGTDFPWHRIAYAAEAFRLRQSAQWYLARARRMKAQAAA